MLSMGVDGSDYWYMQAGSVERGHRESRVQCPEMTYTDLTDDYISSAHKCSGATLRIGGAAWQVVGEGENANLSVRKHGRSR